MPIKVKKSSDYFAPEFLENPVELNTFSVLLFSKTINPVMYVLGKYAYESLANMNIQDKDTMIEEWQNHKDATIVDKMNQFFGTDLKFSDDLLPLKEDGRTIFHVKSEGRSNENGVYISIKSEDLLTDNMNKSLLGCLLDIKIERKKRLVYSYDNLISPWFWVDKMSVFFTKNTDASKKMDKMKTMLISLERLIDKSTRKTLNIKDEDKADTLSVIRYIIRNFEALSQSDNQDLANKRLRLYEYMFYPLRKYFSDHIYTVLNSATRSKAVLDRMFSNLSPMYIIKQTVKNELLRYYNAPNEINLYTCLLRYTFRGPQSLNKTVSVSQRDLHPSYAGRLSLIASSASDPGLSGNLSPFIKVYDNYFEEQK